MIAFILFGGRGSDDEDGPECHRCGGTLKIPEKGAQYECDDCGMVVAPDQVREKDRSGWKGDR